MQNVSIITDIQFLTSVSYALPRIVNLSETFGRFKQTIFSTSAVQLPQSAHETREVVEEVMNYINYFVCPDDASLNPTQRSNAQLSEDVDIQYIQGASNQLKHKSISVRNNCTILRTKLSTYNIHC